MNMFKVLIVKKKETTSTQFISLFDACVHFVHMCEIVQNSNTYVCVAILNMITGDIVVDKSFNIEGD